MIDTVHKNDFDATAGQGAACTEFMIPMRDGVRLATDVHLPAGFRPGIDAPLPTMIQFHSL